MEKKSCKNIHLILIILLSMSFFLLFGCSSSGDSADDATTDGATTYAFEILTVPHNLQSEVGTTTKIAVNSGSIHCIDINTFVTNTSGTECSGSFQLSSDDFDTCVEMSSTLYYSCKVLTLAPTSELLSNTTYKIKITTDLTGSDGDALSENYLMTFTTGFGADTTSPEIQTSYGCSPENGATNVSTSLSYISIQFGEPMDPASLASSPNYTSDCSGLAQLSSDDFNTCFESSAQAGITDNSALYLIPLGALEYSTTYKVKVTTDVQDLSGNSLAEESISSFTTEAEGVDTGGDSTTDTGGDSTNDTGDAEDTTAPTNASVTISEGESTSSTSITLSLSASDDTSVTAYYASETSITVRHEVA